MLYRTRSVTLRDPETKLDTCLFSALGNRGGGELHMPLSDRDREPSF